jgi:hypothetical protein
VSSPRPTKLRIVRLRALPLLLALTVADYALWDWSIADGHDIVSLVAGLTLLPLAALTLGMLAIASLRVLRFLLGAVPRRTSTAGAGVEVEAREARPEGASESDSSGRLAA